MKICAGSRQICTSRLGRLLVKGEVSNGRSTVAHGIQTTPAGVIMGRGGDGWYPMVGRPDAMSDVVPVLKPQQRPAFVRNKLLGHGHSGERRYSMPVRVQGTECVSVLARTDCFRVHPRCGKAGVGAFSDRCRRIRPTVTVLTGTVLLGIVGRKVVRWSERAIGAAQQCPWKF